MKLRERLVLAYRQFRAGLRGFNLLQGLANAAADARQQGEKRREAEEKASRLAVLYERLVKSKQELDARVASAPVRVAQIISSVGPSPSRANLPPYYRTLSATLQVGTIPSAFFSRVEPDLRVVIDFDPMAVDQAFPEQLSRLRQDAVSALLLELARRGSLGPWV